MSKPTTDKLDDILKQTLEDRRLSRSEKRALADVFADYKLGADDKAFVRHRAFAQARELLTKTGDRQVLDWLEDVVKLVHYERPRDSTIASVHFSPGDECRRRIARLLKGARHQIDICVFTLTDDRLSKEILEAHHRGVPVRLLSDNDKMFDRGADVERLAEAGVAVAVDVTDHHMHHKFAVFDTRTVITGSYNWTRSAANHNHENIVVSDDPQIVDPYQRKFDELWAELAAPSTR